MKEEKQRLIRTLADAYQSGWAKWLFGGLCCQLLLPFLLKTALLYIEKHSLDVLTLFLADSAGILGGAAFVLAAARSARPDKRFPFRLLFSGILPLLAVFYGRELLLSLLQTYLAPMFQNLWSVWIPAVLINATASVLTSMLLFHVVETVTGEKRAKGVSVSAIFSAVIMVGLFMGSAMLSSAVALLQPAGDSVFAAGLARLVSAIVQWAVLTGILAAASRRPLATGLPTEMPSAQKPSGEDDASAAPPPKSPVWKSGWFRPALSCLVLALTLLWGALPTTTEAGSTGFLASMEQQLSAAQSYLSAGDYLSARKEYVDYLETLDALEQYAEGGHFGSLHASAHTRNETLAQLVNITAGANELTLLEEQYRQGKITSALCFRLLEAYRQAEELSDAQKELQQDAVVQLAAAQIYSGAAQEETGLSPSAVERLLAGRAQGAVQYNCADLISWAQAGDSVGESGVDNDIMHRTMGLAEDFPEEIAYQYLVLYMLDGYPVVPGSSQSSEILACVDRYDTLYREELMAEDSEDERLAHMKKLTGIYLKLGDTAKGAAYAQRAAEETGDPFLTEQAMYGYFMLAQGEECLELAEAALKEDPDSFIALSYAGRAAMLLDDYPAVADYGVRLSDIAKESDDPYADYMLYQFVSYLTVEDSWYAMSDRFPGAACYHELPEEQLKQIQENEYLNAYIQAFAASTDNTVVDLGYYRWEDPEGERALELADALISMKEEAGFPHYIRGMVLNGVDRYEEAIREYTAALAQQPDEHYIWYALGACYEELGDLQNAQQAFQISLDIMPKIGSSHTGDWTGVSVHAGFALERVRGQLAQGGN